MSWPNLNATYYAFTIYLHFYDFLPLKKVAMVVMLLFMPDSPKYLIAESKTPEARKALQWFRGPQFDVDEELRSVHDINSVLHIFCLIKFSLLFN